MVGEPPRSGTRSSPPPSKGLRKRHRPSGEVQFAETAPDPGGCRGASRGSRAASSTPGGGGGRMRGRGRRGERRSQERGREGEREEGERDVEGGKAPSESTRMPQTVPQHDRRMPSPTDQRAPHGTHVPPHRPLPWQTNTRAPPVNLQAGEKMDHVEMAPGMRHHPASRTLKTAPAILTHSNTR